MFRLRDFKKKIIFFLIIVISLTYILFHLKSSKLKISNSPLEEERLRKIQDQSIIINKKGQEEPDKNYLSSVS